jgi:hypothetical protein
MVTQMLINPRMNRYQKGTQPHSHYHPPTPKKYLETVQINSLPERRSEMKK